MAKVLFSLLTQRPRSVVADDFSCAVDDIALATFVLRLPSRPALRSKYSFKSVIFKSGVWQVPPGDFEEGLIRKPYLRVQMGSHNLRKTPNWGAIGEQWEE